MAHPHHLDPIRHASLWLRANSLLAQDFPRCPKRGDFPKPNQKQCSCWVDFLYLKLLVAPKSKVWKGSWSEAASYCLSESHRVSWSYFLANSELLAMCFFFSFPTNCWLSIVTSPPLPWMSACPTERTPHLRSNHTWWISLDLVSPSVNRAKLR